MAENKGYMTLSDEQGSIHISEEVIAAIAVGAVREVEGVSGMMGNLGTSVADLVTNKKGAQKNAKGVKIEMTETGLVLDIYLTVAYGHAIPEGCGLCGQRYDRLHRGNGEHPCGRRDPGLIARLNKREKDERSYDTEYRTGNCRASFLRIELHG